MFLGRTRAGVHIFHFIKDTVFVCNMLLISGSHDKFRYSYTFTTMSQLQIHGYHCAASTFVSPFVSVTGIDTGPPGEFGNLAVKISTPSAVTRRVCSIKS